MLILGIIIGIVFVVALPVLLGAVLPKKVTGKNLLKQNLKKAGINCECIPEAFFEECTQNNFGYAKLAMRANPKLSFNEAYVASIELDASAIILLIYGSYGEISQNINMPIIGMARLMEKYNIPHNLSCEA